MRKMTLRSKNLLLHVVILTVLACRILIYGQAGHLSSCSWPSSWCQVNRELCNVKWTMHRYGGCQFIWNTLWRIFFSWPAEVISPAPLLSERLSPLWLPQVLNQSLSCQCTCVGYIYSREQWNYTFAHPFVLLTGMCYTVISSPVYSLEQVCSISKL